MLLDPLFNLASTPALWGASVLSRSEETDYVKLILFAVGAVIWVISAIAKSVGKQAKSTEQVGAPPDGWPADAGQPAVPTLPPQVVQPPQAPPRPPILARSTIAPALPAAQAFRRRPPPIAKPVPKKKKRPMPPALPLELLPEEASPYTVAPLDAVAPSIARRSPAVSGPMLDAAGIRRWMRPQVMRHQFVLTELFDPPASLRETH